MTHFNESITIDINNRLLDLFVEAIEFRSGKDFSSNNLKDDNLFDISLNLKDFFWHQVIKFCNKSDK